MRFWISLIFGAFSGTTLAGVRELAIELTMGWSAPAHHTFLNRAFPQLTPTCLLAMQAGSTYADGDQFQTDSFTHMHAMRAKAQSVEEASEAMRKFIELQFTLARHARSEEQQCFYRGVGLHPVMDSTSPVHQGFQEWDPIPYWSLRLILQALLHDSEIWKKVSRMLEHGDILHLIGIASQEDAHTLEAHPALLEQTLELIRGVDQIQFEMLRELERKIN